MSRILLGEIAIERKETCKGNKNGFPIVGLEHLTPEQVTLSDWDEDRSNTFTKLFYEGDILFGRRRAYLKKAVVAPFDGICSGDITVIKAIPERILPELLPFIIQNDSFFQYAVGKSAGSLSPRVKWEHLRNYEFELPNIEKQRELAKILWAMEETKKSYRKLLQLSDELVKCQFVEMFGNPMRNDRGWPIKKIREVAPAIAYSGQIESIKGCYWLLNLDMVEAHTGRILDKVMVPREEIGVSTVKFSPENVLYSKLRPYLNKVSNPDGFGYVTTEMVPLLPDRRYINPIFLSALLRGNEFLSYIEKQVAGTKMPRVQMNVFWGLDLILPPLSLQEKYVSIIRQNEKYKFDLEQTLAELSATSRKLIAEEFG